MTDAAPIALHIADASLRELEARALTALPISLVRGDAPAESIVAVPGADGWVRRVADAVASGARGVLVEAPVAIGDDDARRLDELATGLPILLHRPYLGNPVLADARHAWPELGGAVLLTSEQFVRPGTDLRAALEVQLAVLRSVLGPIASIETVSATDASTSVTATFAGGAAAVLGCVTTTAQPTRLQLQVLAPPTRLTVEIPTEEASRPGSVVITDPNGERRLPTSYESVERAAWRRIMAAVRSGATLPDAAEFQEDRRSAALLEAAG